MRSRNSRIGQALPAAVRRENLFADPAEGNSKISIKSVDRLRDCFPLERRASAGRPGVAVTVPAAGHCEEPPVPRFARPEDRLRDKAIPIR